MVNERLQKSSSWTPQPQAKSSPSASRPFPVPAQAPTPQEIENQAFNENKQEALGLQLQAKYGSITPEGQERLTVLQAKMDAFRHNRLDSIPRQSTSLLEIPNLCAPRETPQPIQPKLTIGKVGDKYEQEADRVAAKVVSQINAPQTQPSAQGKTLQRKEMLDEEEELQMKPMVQLQLGDGGMAATPDLESSIKQAKGSGQSLCQSIRQPMEQAFGADFSGVKVHTDAQSDRLNQSIQAKAFTTGRDIFFRQGAYKPGSRGGQELLAHELTHVIQQNGSAVQRKQAVNPSPEVPATPTTYIQRVRNKSSASRNQTANQQGGGTRNRTPRNQQGGASQNPTNRVNKPSGQPPKNKAPLKAGGSRTTGNNSQVPSPQSGTSPTQTTNPFLQKYKPKVRDKQDDLGYKLVDSLETGPNLPSAPNQPEDKIGYVINMAAVPGEETPGKVAQTYYEQGFDNEPEVVKRLGMVMGVNKYRSIDGRSHSLVDTHMKKTGNPEFMVRVFGFTWELVNWVEEKENKADVNTVSNEFNQLNNEQQEEVLAKEKSFVKQENIPYGLIREKVTAHSYTKTLVKELSKYNKHVYIHLGDADALSLLAPEKQSPSQGEDTTNQSKSLFSRYDKILEDKQYPLMAIGGYDFRYESDGGDLDSANPKERLTYLANQLDIAARKAIASIVPEAVYPTEPNLVFLAQGPDNSNDLFGLDLFEDSGELKTDKSGELYVRGPREGRKFQKNLLETSKDQYDTQKIVYAPEASVATSSKRFKLTDQQVAKQKEALNKGDAEFKRKIIQDVIRQTQSFLSSNTFTLEVLSSSKAKISNKSPFKATLLKEYNQRIESKIQGFLNKATTSNSSPFKAPNQNPKVEIVANIINAVEAELNDSKYQGIWEELGKAINEIQALYNK